MSNNKLTLPQRIALECLWIICRVFALLPDCIRHGVFTNLSYIVLRLLRYRKKVMMDNLRRSFPDKTEKEIKGICRKAYYNLAEQITNTISMAGISEKELLHRMQLPNVEQIRIEMNGGNTVFMMGHYGPWEAGLAVSLTFPEQRL
ncbi:MAG: lauroyl acyltransferase, partial [Alistipes sp.]|nr:lauroyl acyltransferase [Alistipes sp.]